MTMTLDEFRATKKILVKDAEWCKDWCPERTSQEVAEYEGETFIYIEGPSDYLLVLENMIYENSDIAELEVILYTWWHPDLTF